MSTSVDGIGPRPNAPALGPQAPIVRLSASWEGQETVCEITEPVTMIGGRRDCGLWLGHPDVSKVHAAIIHLGHSLLVCDLRSRSGTFINDAPITTAPLRPGDVLCIGPVPVTVQTATPLEPRDSDARFTPPLKLARPDGDLETTVNGAVLGRKSSCDVPIDDPDVSAAHALLFMFEGCPCVWDLGSRSGTAINGERVPAGALLVGDELTIGTTTLRLIDGPRPPVVAAPAEAAPAAEPTAPAGGMDAGLAAMLAGGGDLGDLERTIATLHAHVRAARSSLDSRAAEIDEQQQAVERRAAEIEAQQQTIESRTAELATQAEQLEQRAADLATTEAELGSRRATLDAHAAELEQRGAAIGEQERQLAERDAALSERAAELETASAALEAGEQSLKERTTALEPREQALSEQSAALEQREAALAERVAALDARDGELAERQAALEAQAAELDARSAEVQEQQQSLQAQQAALDARAAELNEREAALVGREAASEALAARMSQFKDALRRATQSFAEMSDAEIDAAVEPPQKPPAPEPAPAKPQPAQAVPPQQPAKDDPPAPLVDEPIFAVPTTPRERVLSRLKGREGGGGKPARGN